MDRLKPVLAAVNDPGELRRVCQVQLQGITAAQDALSKEAKLIRDIRNRYSGPSDLLSSKGRSAKVLEAALRIG